MSKHELDKRKALLLGQIQQQRLDLSAGRRNWLEATEAYDRGWNTLLSLRSYALIASSVVAIWSVCLLYTSPSPRDRTRSRMPSSA